MDTPVVYSFCYYAKYYHSIQHMWMDFWEYIQQGTFLVVGYLGPKVCWCLLKYIRYCQMSPREVGQPTFLLTVYEVLVSSGLASTPGKLTWDSAWEWCSCQSPADFSFLFIHPSIHPSVCPSIRYSWAPTMCPGTVEGAEYLVVN